ncbi:MAG: hypothetical protein K9W44_14810 [Candidatus Lokiarchaeota archaeon]|nr:hypothetical protein [Candidatus Harpocratesius repetitus]
MAITSTNQNNGLNPTAVILESFQYLRNQHPDISIQQMEMLFEKELINQIKIEICRYNFPKVIPKKEILKWKLQESRTPKKKKEIREYQIKHNEKVLFYLTMQNVIKSSKIDEKDISFFSISKNDIVGKKDSIISQLDFYPKDEKSEEINNLKSNILKEEKTLPFGFKNNQNFADIPNRSLDFFSFASNLTESTLISRNLNWEKSNEIRKKITKSEENEIIEIDSIIEEIIDYKPKRYRSKRSDCGSLLDLIDIANN